MDNTSCKEQLSLFPTISEADVLQSTFIANCVFNNFLSYTAIMLNIVTIHAIRKTPSLPRTLKTLLLSLAVSDVGVGLFTQSIYTTLLVKWLQESIPNCNIYKVFLTTAGMFSLASFQLSVVVVSVDRFLAIHLHLRYQEVVTHKRVIAVVISIWVLSAFLPLMSLWVPPIVRTLYICILVVVGLILTTVVYIKIYLVVRRHKNQIEALQAQPVENGELENFASLIKSAVGIFYVYLVFLLSYLPFFISLAAIKINGPNTALKKLFLLSITLVYINSSLNPVIYCWKMRHIRHAILDLLRNMSWLRNRISHLS